MKNLSFRIFFLAVFLAATLYGCGPLTSTTVTLNREVYFSQIQPAEFACLKGKRILLGTITDQSSNTTNLNYFNPEKTVGYRLYYTSPQNSMAQPVVSFLWYTLKKGFEQAGVVVVEDGPLYDAEVYMTLQSVTDEEIRFNALVTMKGAELYKKDYAVGDAGRARAPNSRKDDTPRRRDHLGLKRKLRGLCRLSRHLEQQPSPYGTR